MLGHPKKQDKLIVLSKIKNVSIMAKNLKKFQNDVENINFIMNGDVLNEKINAIIEMIALSKTNIVCKKLLSKREIKQIEAIMLPMKTPSTAQTLSLVSVSIIAEDNRISYLLDVPMVQTKKFKSIRLETIPQNNRMKDRNVQKILSRDNTTLVIEDPCLEVGKVKLCYIEKTKNITSDMCIHSIIYEKYPSCNYVETKEEEEMKLLNYGTILMKNVKNTKIYNNCDTLNHTISGSYLITFDKCSITVNGRKFTSTEIKIHQKLELLPMVETKIEMKNLIKIEDIQLSTTNMGNHHRLEYLEIQSGIGLVIIVTFVSILGAVTVYLISRFNKMKKLIKNSEVAKGISSAPEEL